MKEKFPKKGTLQHLFKLVSHRDFLFTITSKDENINNNIHSKLYKLKEKTKNFVCHDVQTSFLSKAADRDRDKGENILKPPYEDINSNSTKKVSFFNSTANSAFSNFQRYYCQ